MKTTLLLAASLLGAFSGCAEVTLPAVFGDHMVIQRGLPVHVWGKAGPGETVSVGFRGHHATTTADDIGEWSVYLWAGEAGGPFELTANGVTIHDILAGDVWVASGQSNMEFHLRDAENGSTEAAGANFPRIRAFHVKNNSAVHPMDDLAADPWVVCSPETAPQRSAVAFFFARELQAKQDVPIGIIETSWGGTPAEAWTSLDALSHDASLMPVFSEWARMSDAVVKVKTRHDLKVKEWEEASARAKAEGKPAPGYPWAPNEHDSWSPAGLYNAMIAPLTPFPIRGAIWYQGESNATTERAPIYARLFQTMIQDWRSKWNQGDFPFLFVQLANFTTGPDAKWPELREAQTRALELRNTGMAVIIDIGNPKDIHPKNKLDVGRRLALAARAISYGEKIEYSGPVFRQAVPEGASLRLWFNHADTGLVSRGPGPRGFEIAGADHKWVPADAQFDGPTIIVSSAAVKSPQLVRYAWSDNPDANLYNAEGLPASPFRSGE
jgi:sialate O-acetylesterase